MGLWSQHSLIRIEKGMSYGVGEKVRLNSSDASGCSKSIVCLRTISSIFVYKLHVCHVCFVHTVVYSDHWFTGTGAINAFFIFSPSAPASELLSLPECCLLT